MNGGLGQHGDEQMTMSVEDLMTGTEEEIRIARVAYPLLHGISVNGDYVKLKKLNDAQSEDDNAKYEVDYGIMVNQEAVGYLDVEKKINWHFGGWPYPRTNIAKHPMNQWISGRFIENSHTIKLKRFSDMQDTSFWVGPRSDWEVYWIMCARDIFEYGVDDLQPTRYRDMPPLPVIAVPNCFGTLCDNADKFTEYILAHLEEAGVING